MKLFSFIVFCLILSACKVDDRIKIKVLYECPENLIYMDEYDTPTELYQWTYKNKIYYYVRSSRYDGMNILYDSECNYICAPDGGLSGGGDGRCPFSCSDSSIIKELIWKR
jgi:hypothetical protein